MGSNRVVLRIYKHDAIDRNGLEEYEKFFGSFGNVYFPGRHFSYIPDNSDHKTVQ